MTIELLINYNDNIISVHLLESGNVFDLKKAIEEKTGVSPQYQNLIGLEMSMQELTNDIPIMALGITNGQNLFLINEEPQKPKEMPKIYKNYTEPFKESNIPPPPRLTVGRYLKPSSLVEILNLINTDEDEFTAFFEQKFGIIHPSFVGGPFSKLYERYKIEKKLIIVFLYGSNIPTLDFCSITLTQENLSKFLDDEQLPFWIGKVNKDIERKFQTLFGTEIPFPFLAVVGNVSHTFSILGLITENMMSAELIEKLQDVLNTHKYNLQLELEEERQRELQRLIKEEQNLAFQKSLAQDKEKERLRQIEEEIKKTTKENKIAFITEARNSALMKREELPLQPDDSNKMSIRVGVRLPDGSRVERRFSTEDTLQSIFDFSECTVAGKMKNETFLDESSPPLDSDKEVIPWSIEKYELVQNYPKKSFRITEGSKKLSEFNFGGQAMLFLQRKSQ